MPHNRGSPDRFVHDDGSGGGGPGGGLTDAELRAAPVDVTVVNFPASQVVTASDLDIRDLTFATDSVDVSGSSVTVSNFPASVEISNDVGNPIPVSGTVTVNEPVSVDDNGGSLTIDAGITLEVTGTASSAAVFSNFPVDVSMYRWVSVQLTGTWSGTVSFQCSNDGVNWVACTLLNTNTANSTTTATVTSTNGIWHGAVAYKHFRLNMTSYTSGTATGVAEFAQSSAAYQTMGIGGLTPGVAATNLGKAEDAAHASGDTGVAVWAVRNDAATSFGADGDYTPFNVDAAGRLRIHQGLYRDTTASATATGVPTGFPLDSSAARWASVQFSGTWSGTVRFQGSNDNSTWANIWAFDANSSNQGSLVASNGIYVVPLNFRYFRLNVETYTSGTIGMRVIEWMGSAQVPITGISKAEDAAHSTGDSGAFILGVRNSGFATLTSADGDYSPIAVDAAGSVHTKTQGVVADGAAISGNPVLIAGQDGTNIQSALTDTGGRFVVTNKLVQPTLADGRTNVPDTATGSGGSEVQTNVGYGYAFNGTNWDRIRGTSADGLLVNLGANNDVVVSATDLDIRNLTFATDTVDVSGSAVTNVVLSDAHDDPNNAIRVNVVAGSSGGPSKVDDAAFTVATDSVAPMGALADDTTPDSVDEGDVGIPRMSLNRNLYSQIRDGQGNERSAYVTASNALKVDGSAVTQPVSGTVTIQDGGNVISVDDAGGSLTVDVGTALPAGTNNIGDVDVLSIPAFGEPQGVHSHNTTPTVYKGNLVLGINYSDLTVNAIDVDSVGRQTVLVEGLPSLSAGANTIGAVNLNAGTNNIGDVDVLTLPIIPAGTNYIGRTDGYNGVVKDNSGDDCTVKVAHLDMTTATTTDIVAAVTNKKIRVLRWFIKQNEAAAATFTWMNGASRATGSPLLVQAASFWSSWQEVAPDRGWLFETSASTALRVTSNANVDVSIAVTYIEVD